MLNPTIYSVSALNEYIRSLFSQDIGLQSIYLKGEISNFHHHSSGHLYFSLKDAKSRIKAVMFAKQAAHLAFTPHDGDQVFVLGRVSVYMENGEYQVYVSEMEPVGLGQSLLALEQLKKKLEAEGLFDPSKKKEIPAFPKAIGLITAKNSAASKDMIVNLQRRYPLVRIYLFSSLVQGEKAPQSLCKALKSAEAYDLDTILIGRGGGANEDLSAFNDETLVRTIAACPIPVISAVGHEINTTLCDLVADRRVSTPTGAAECATPDMRDLRLHMINLEERMEIVIRHQCQLYRQRVEVLKRTTFLQNPARMYQEKRETLSLKKHRLLMSFQEKLGSSLRHVQLSKTAFSHAIHDRMDQYHHSIQQAQQQLNALSPLAVLDRGYSYMHDEEGHVIDSIDKITIGQKIQTTTKDGIMISTVIQKEKKDGRKEKL